MPKVSVIIPAYNAEKHISFALDSALTQTCLDIEVVVIDDGSTDNTLDIVRGYGNKINVVAQKNSGPSAARNKGIQMAKGEYIAFLDSDDIWLSNKLEEQVSLMERNPDCGATNCSGFYINEEGKEIGQYQQCTLSREKTLKELLFHNCIKTLSGALIKRACFEKIGLFDAQIAVGEDWDMWLRFCKEFEFLGSDLKLVKYRIRKESQSSRAKKNLENELFLLNKLFLKFPAKYTFFTKRKALSYRYQAAAIAYREEGDRRAVRGAILKSIFYYPLVDKRTISLMAFGFKICV